MKKKECVNCYFDKSDDGDGGPCFHCLNKSSYLDKNSKEAKELDKELKKEKENWDKLMEIKKKAGDKADKQMLENMKIIDSKENLIGSQGIGYLIKQLQEFQINYYREKLEYEKEIKRLKDANNYYDKLDNSDKYELLHKLEKDLDYHILEYVSQKQLDDIDKFKKKHYKKCKNGGHFQFDMVGTGVGTAIKIICPVCGEELDITDYDMW